MSATTLTKPARTPGRLERAARRKARAAFRAAVPYLTVIVAAVMTGAVTGSVLLTGIGIGGSAAVATIRLWEAYGWHRRDRLESTAL